MDVNEPLKGLTYMAKASSFMEANFRIFGERLADVGKNWNRKCGIFRKDYISLAFEHSNIGDCQAM